MRNFHFFNVISTFLIHFTVYLLIFISCWLFWTVLGGFGKFRNPRWRTNMADVWKSWRNSRQMWRHQLMKRTSKETISDVLYILKVSLLLLLYSRTEIRGASGYPPPPGSRRSNKSPVWIGLNCSCLTYFIYASVQYCRNILRKWN